MQLYEEGKMVQAVPLFEEVAAANPKDTVVMERLGVALYSSSYATSDPVEKKRLTLRALLFLKKAKELGDNSNLLQTLLENIPADGSNSAPFSNQRDADSAMKEAEAAFTRGDMDRAIESYQRALILDPKLYEAALFIGDAYFKSNRSELAGEWFSKAIEINPDRETAYRYWGDALVKQGKKSEARMKFIEAFITEPYNRLGRMGLVQWGQNNKVPLTHPNIVSPNSFSTEGKNATITIDQTSMEKKDGSNAWMSYELTRASWQGDRFKKEFPHEKEYRHTLREEADAYNSVALVLQEQIKSGGVEKLNPVLETLLNLKKDQLIEAYVLLARPDKGIVQDFAGYIQQHRDRLITYMDKYVVPAASPGSASAPSEPMKSERLNQKESAVPVSVPKRVRVSQGVMAGLLIHKVTPIYAQDAKRAHVTGSVIMQAIVSKEGEVQDLKVISGSPMLVESTLDAVKKWRYKPYILNGEPVEVETTITVNFSIGG